MAVDVNRGTCVNFSGEVFVGIAADFEAISIVAGCLAGFNPFRLSDAGGAASYTVRYVGRRRRQHYQKKWT